LHILIYVGYFKTFIVSPDVDFYDEVLKTIVLIIKNK